MSLIVAREEAVILDELDFAPPCEQRKCGQEATHESHWSCGCVRILCPEHAEQVAALDRDVTSGDGVWYCLVHKIRKITLIRLDRL